MINLNNNSMTDDDEPMKMEESIADWETGLPSVDDLTSLSQSLIPAELASAFKITAETPRTMIEVNRASQSTFSSLNSTAPNFKPYDNDPSMTESDSPEDTDPKRVRSTDEDAIGDCAGEQGKSAKRPRLVWTPQLHKRFVEVVAHLGLKNAVPKTIMQLMNVEGLTRENVASHLQKYRLYVKRMQENDDSSPPSDNLFASTSIPHAQSFNESYSGQGNEGSNRSHGGNNNNSSHVEMQMPNMPMAMMGMAEGNASASGGFYEGGSSLHHHHHYHHHYQQQYGDMGQQQKEWPGNNYGSNAFSHHLAQK